jgi:hypothetical protein
MFGFLAPDAGAGWAKANCDIMIGATSDAAMVMVVHQRIPFPFG